MLRESMENGIHDMIYGTELSHQKVVGWIMRYQVHKETNETMLSQQLHKQDHNISLSCLSKQPTVA